MSTPQARYAALRCDRQDTRDDKPDCHHGIQVAFNDSQTFNRLGRHELQQPPQCAYGKSQDCRLMHVYAHYTAFVLEGSASSIGTATNMCRAVHGNSTVEHKDF